MKGRRGIIHWRLESEQALNCSVLNSGANGVRLRSKEFAQFSHWFFLSLPLRFTSSNPSKRVLNYSLLGWTENWTSGSVLVAARTRNWTSDPFSKVRIQTQVQDWTTVALRNMVELWKVWVDWTPDSYCTIVWWDSCMVLEFVGQLQDSVNVDWISLMHDTCPSFDPTTVQLDDSAIHYWRKYVSSTTAQYEWGEWISFNEWFVKLWFCLDSEVVISESSHNVGWRSRDMQVEKSGVVSLKELSLLTGHAQNNAWEQ